MVPPKELRKKVRIWILLKSLYGTRDACQVFETYVDEGQRSWLSEKCGGPVFVLGAMLEVLGVHWRDDFIFGIPDDKADDLEQLMREVFKVNTANASALVF